ncbi:NADP-dependent isocitrate dehydrogenase [bacterium]|nr:NADP-dependent isocitrate dehydrogenase [bacterium]
MTHQKITVIPGDGIGPEVVNAALQVLEAANVPLTYEFCEAGASVFLKGDPTGVPQATVDSIRQTRIALKGPLETPVGYGEKSANVTLRKQFETFANTRPVTNLPGIITPFSDRNIDLVVVRENVEDLYAGIEYMETPDVAQGLKLMSRQGCEKIIRFAFETARALNKKSVHCATKANIMKLTEGLMKRTFESVNDEYPDIEGHHIIIDNCAHQLVIRPELFDIIVTSNMNGDILSDLTSGLVGGLGVAASSNIGYNAAIFEAVHGSAPDIAGKNLANPTALISASIIMLRHLELFNEATSIEKALYTTLESGQLTGDLAKSNPALGTKEFTNQVIGNLGKSPTQYTSRPYAPVQIKKTLPKYSNTPHKRILAGIDVYFQSQAQAKEIEKIVQSTIVSGPFTLDCIANRGSCVHINDTSDTHPIDLYRIRLLTNDPDAETQIASFLQAFGKIIHWTHLEKLHQFESSKFKSEKGFTSIAGNH